ncbi:MAG: glycoside hydrolase family 127 protein [Bacteroidales bacterium]|nr:glycoside hydrolase family 127 protein [Bacteroidales bacterium]
MRNLFITLVLLPMTLFGQSGHYPIQPVPFTSVTVTDNFWKPRIRTNHEVTIPIAFGHCEATGRVKNFEVAGGLTEGTFCSAYPFDDSDVFKIVEGASYSLQTFADSALEAYLDTLIYKFAMAQEEDGYLYTNRTIMGDSGHEWIGTERWQNTHLYSHELYNMGHFFEAAVAHYNATGKRSMLDLAIKAANRIDEDFGWDAKVSYPGHQGIAIGLVKLYRVSGDERYLDLAKFFLDARKDGMEYNQAHKPVTEQTEAVGHAVRATYMYSGMADVAAITGDQDYIDAITRIWQDLTWTKTYVTGGIGASGGNEGFAEPYHLPNATAYCETCASIGNIFFNQRLFLLYGEARYYDLLERILYNAMLSGVSLSGDHFFYPNVLESDGSHKRSEWFGCACCPSNITRFIPSVPGYIYAYDEESVYVNLYMSNDAVIDRGKDTVYISQYTGYPWDGRVNIVLNNSGVMQFPIHLRIPGWTGSTALDGDLYRFTEAPTVAPVLRINGEQVELNIENGYAVVHRFWHPGDHLDLLLPMEVRKLEADVRVKADSGMIAFQRGPLVFAAEWPDNDESRALNLFVDADAEAVSVFEPGLLQGTQTISLPGIAERSYSEEGFIMQVPTTVKLIPYHLWNNRGPGEMRVWLPQMEQ